MMGGQNECWNRGVLIIGVNGEHRHGQKGKPCDRPMFRCRRQGLDDDNGDDHQYQESKIQR